MAQRKAKKRSRNILISDELVFADVCSRSGLTEAWGKVWRNAGAAGGDRISVYDFAARAHMNIGILANELKDGSYHPGPVRIVDIPKSSGGLRRLTIPCVIDRIAQTAAASALVPYLDEEFEDASFGYRPGRSVKQAVARIQMLQRSGLTHVIDADIDDYFDTIPHDGLLNRLAESMSGGPLSELIALWLADAAPLGRGLAQGSPLSPLLANLYLDRLDEAFSRRGARIVRFADDFVILTEKQQTAEKALDAVTRLLDEHGLKLNREKTKVTDFAKGFRFLGHMFVRSMALKVSAETADENDFKRLLAGLAKQDAAEEEEARHQAQSLAKAEAHGYSPGLRNLYIMERGRRLAIRNEAFAVEEIHGHHDPLTGTNAQWRELLAIPHQRIDRIDIGPHGEATPQALDHALSTNTVVCFVDGHGATQGLLAQALAPHAKRHLAQAGTALDDIKRLELARILVEGRLRTQRAMLRKLCRERDVVPASVTRAISNLTRLIGRGESSRILHATSISSAMGYEGAAAATYWPAICALAHPEFGFTTRERENPDPANIALNFLAWLLHRDVSVAVLGAGLHAGFGALHATDDRRDACVYDLMEEFRSHLIEGLFVYVTNRRILRPSMFSRQTGNWRLKREGGDALIRAYENRVSALIAWPRKTRRKTFRRLIVEQARAFARHHEGQETYRPFELDY